jgi:tetratricopeptide (TPR) repeat protein
MVKKQLFVMKMGIKSSFSWLLLFMVSGLWVTETPLPILAQEESPENLVYICENWRDAQSPDKALEACNKALEIGEVGIWSARGDLLLLGLNNNLEAVTSYNEAIRADAYNSQVWTRRCKALVNLGKYDEAMTSCETALRVNNKWGEVSSAQAWNYQGEAQAGAVKPEDALYSYGWAIQLNPDYALAWVNQCGLFYRQKQYNEAINSCDRALSSNQYWEDSSPTIALTKKAQSLRALGWYDESLVSFNQALALDEKNPDAWTEYGRVLDILGKHGEASAAHTQAVALNEKYALALVNQCYNLNSLGQYEDALKACQKAILEGDGRWGEEGISLAWNQQGVALTGLKRYEEALGALNRAIGINGEDSHAWTNKAVAFWYLGRYDEAVNSAQRAISINPYFTLGWFNYGRVLTTLGEFDAALAAYQNALRGDGYLEDSSLFPNIWVNVSAVFWRMEKYDDGIKAADNALTKNPDLPDAWYNRGLSSFALGQYRQAALAFSRAINLDETNANYWAGQGIALRYLEQYEQALASLNKALELNPNHPQAMANQAIVQQKLANLTAPPQPPIPPPPQR